MNPFPLPALTADGSKQPVHVPRGRVLYVRPIGATAKFYADPASADYLTLAADETIPFGPFTDGTMTVTGQPGATVAVEAEAGTRIELACGA